MSGLTALIKQCKSTLKLAWPLVLSQIGQILFNVFDTAMVGRLGVVPLGAVAFARSFFFVTMVIGIGIAAAIAPLVAQCQGANRPQDGGEVLRHTLFLNLVCSILIIALIHFIFIPNLGSFHQPPEVIALATGYLKFISWGLIPIYVFHCFRQFIDGLGRTMPAMVITLIGLCIKILLNWVLIFGNLGVPAMGVTGAALSLILTQGSMAVLMVVYALNIPFTKPYRPQHWLSTLNMRWLKRVAALGIPSSMQYVFEVSAFASAVIMMGWISTVMLAAHEIAINLAAFTFMFALGTSFATSIRVGKAIGDNNLADARYAGFASMILVAAAMSVFGMIFYFARAGLPQLYIQDIEVIQACSQLLVIAAFFQIFDGLQAIAVGALRGLEDVKIPTLITFFAYWVVSLPLGYILAFKYDLGGIGVWMGLAVGLGSSACLLTWRFYKKTMPTHATLKG